MRGTTSNENLAPGANFPTVFNYGSSKLRTIKKNDETWFCAKDVCTSLGVKQPIYALESLDEDEKAMWVLPTPHKNSTKAWFINESGLYHLIFISRKPEAKAFRKWVTAEVLPALRSQGAYAMPVAQEPEADHSADLVKSLFQLADNIGRVQSSYRRTALLRNLNSVKRQLKIA